MKIEILFPEACNLFGDMANVRFLKLCLPEAVFIETKLNEKPRFLDEDVDLVYMGACSENTQKILIKNLSQYKDEIKNKIENGTHFLFTGNALEILGNYLENEQGEKTSALGIFDFYVKQNFSQRHNSECEMKFGDMRIIAFKSQFTKCYPNNLPKLFETVKGMGMNLETKDEGIHYKNFYGTYLIAPLLMMNPNFAKYFLNQIGANIKALPCEDELVLAYQKRLADFDKNVSVEPEKYKYM